MLKIEYLDESIDVYDITVEDNHNFYADGILVHKCVEITQNTEPQTSLDGDDGLIALCTLAAFNLGKIKHPDDFERPARLLVRALNNLLDYQDYPVKAAERHTKLYRPLGIGVINHAYFLAKNGTNYTNTNLELIHEYAEAYAYYLIKASCDLAEEKGSRIPGHAGSKYCQGILPIDHYKKDVDDLVSPVYKKDWETLRARLIEFGIYNSTLGAFMPAESSALVSNGTNGVESPRSLVSIKGNKDGVYAQVVPEIKKLKNVYELLWDQKSPRGYMSIMAVWQKFLDQSISTNTSYNPAHFPEEKISANELLSDVLYAYKYGLKTLYYNNTNDLSGEEIEDDEDCESCKI